MLSTCKNGECILLISIIMCFSKKDVTNTYDELARPIDNTHLDESLWNDKCDYLSPDKINNINPENYNLVTSTKYM